MHQPEESKIQEPLKPETGQRRVLGMRANGWWTTFFIAASVANFTIFVMAVMKNIEGASSIFILTVIAITIASSKMQKHLASLNKEPSKQEK